MSDLIADVISVVSSTVLDSPQKTASGSRISFAIRRQCPGVDFKTLGYRNIRDFIRQNVPAVMESEHRAGMDVLYVPSGPERRVLPAVLDSSARPSGFVTLLLGNPRAWKTFANPYSSFRIFLKPDGSELRIHPDGVKPDGAWLMVSPMSADALIQIAKDFTAQLPELYRPALNESLQSPKWWIPYFELLGSLGLKSKWIVYRRRRIVDHFSSALTVQAAGNPAVVTNVTLPPPAGKRHPSPPVVAAVTPQAQDSFTAENIRRFALAAVQRMTELELRTLNIPLGYLVDSIQNLK